MTRTNQWTAAACFLLLATALPKRAAADDEFNKIVRHIESAYHVHRNHPFLMAFASMVANVGRFAGVKNVKLALFEDQDFSRMRPDLKFNEVVQAALGHDWQPIVQSWSRRSNEYNYIYAQYSGHDVKLFIINLEPDQAVVLQVKTDPDKLTEFVNLHSPGQHRHHHHENDENGDTAALRDVDATAAGMCRYETPRTTTQASNAAMNNRLSNF